MVKKFTRNEKYKQNEIAKLIPKYHTALDANDQDTVTEIHSYIYNFTEKYVCKTLWSRYESLMQNPVHQEDLIQEVWEKIFEKLKNYDPDKAAITTFITPWISNAVCNYTSKNISNTSVYYANAMQQVNQAQIYCESAGLNANDMDVLAQVAQLSKKAVKNALDLIEKKDSVSYEALIDIGEEYTSNLKGPEESVLEAENEREVMEIFKTILTDREMMLLQMLINQYHAEKRVSYRKMMETLPGSNIPQIKKEVSKMFKKIRTNPKFIELYRQSDPDNR